MEAVSALFANAWVSVSPRDRRDLPAPAYAEKLIDEAVRVASGGLGLEAG